MSPASDTPMNFESRESFKEMIDRNPMSSSLHSPEPREQTAPLDLQQQHYKEMLQPKEMQPPMTAPKSPNKIPVSSYKRVLTSPPRSVLSPPDSILSPPLSNGSLSPPMRQQMPLSPPTETLDNSYLGSTVNGHDVAHPMHHASMLKKLQQSASNGYGLDIKCEPDSRKSVIESNNKIPVQCS